MLVLRSRGCRLTLGERPPRVHPGRLHQLCGTRSPSPAKPPYVRGHPLFASPYLTRYRMQYRDPYLTSHIRLPPSGLPSTVLHDYILYVEQE